MLINKQENRYKKKRRGRRDRWKIFIITSRKYASMDIAQQ